MKNAVKISISAAMITVAIAFLVGCSKDDESLVSGGFNSVITAKVDGVAGITITSVLAVNDPEYDPNTGVYYGNIVGEPVSFSSGSFAITLPTSGIKSSYLTDITEFFEYFMKADDKGNLKVSNPSARIMDIDFIGFNSVSEKEFYVMGTFFYATSDKSVTCMFVYVDSDVDVTGGANVSVSLKKGWNRVYISDKLTTKAPNGLKWYFDPF